MKEIISTENMEQILTRIDTLANKLGVTAEYLFGVYVKQAYVEVVQYIILASIWGAVFTITLLAFKKSMSGSWDNPTFYNIAAITGAVLSFVLTLAMMIEIGVAITCYLNPEYFAFKEVLSNIK